MERWQWEEFEAQVEDHGYNKIEFILSTSDEFHPGNHELYVDEVKFEDGKIKVVLS